MKKHRNFLNTYKSERWEAAINNFLAMLGRLFTTTYFDGLAI